MSSCPSLAGQHVELDCAVIIERFKREAALGLWSLDHILLFEARLEQLKARARAKLEPWQRIQISRHAQRPRALQVLGAICSQFEELFGDRAFGDDPALVGGLGVIEGKRFVCIAQEKGIDLDSRMLRNFGMMQPEGYRKALRLMRLAEKFDLPVFCLIDTPGAYAGLEAEERGQAWAIAENLKAMARLRTPIIALILAEGCSGGALGIGLADCLGILEHAYYSVISPEGCASILWKDTGKKECAARALKLTSESLLQAGLVDEVLLEPEGGAHLDPHQVYRDIQEFLVRWLGHLRQFNTCQLLERRYEKFRQMGRFEESS